jgi:phosphatidylserine decarboxylase
MLYLPVLLDILLGITIASIGAHPKLCNLDLLKSIKIGLLSGLFGGFVFLAFQFFIPDMDLLNLLFSIVGILVAGMAIVLWNFFRDPNRTPPSDGAAIISPADGHIVYAREIRHGTIPCAIKGKKNIRLAEIAKTSLLSEADGYIIGICMNILDVHVTRSPVDGTVISNHEIPGKTLSPKQWRSEIDNPRTTMVIKNGSIQLGLVEMGTPYISRVISYVLKGEAVRKGDRIGKITWGSQFDVIIPSRDVDIIVKEGDKVYAGETILARLRSTEKV